MTEKLDTYVDQYSAYIDDCTKYDNGNVRIEYNTPGKVMWLKRMAYEVADLTEITSTHSNRRIVMYFK